MNRWLRRIYVGGLVLASVLVLTAADTGSLPKPPVAKVVPHVTEVNGHKMVDNYFWLRDKPNPEVRAYLEAENVYTDAVMKPTEGFQKKLYDEMLGRIKETDVEVPYREGRLFLLRADGGGEAVRDPLPEKGQHGRAGRSAAGHQRNGEGAGVHVGGGVCGESGWESCWRIRTTTRGSGNTRWR